MALKMTNREVDGVSVVALDGRIVLGEESNALREKVKSLIAEGKKKIVLNMDNITFIDSAGLGTLVAAHHSVKTQGASLRLCHLGSKFQEVLQITKLPPASPKAPEHKRPSRIPRATDAGFARAPFADGHAPACPLLFSEFLARSEPRSTGLNQNRRTPVSFASPCAAWGPAAKHYLVILSQQWPPASPA